MTEPTESKSVTKRLAAQRGTPPSEQNRQKAREMIGAAMTEAEVSGIPAALYDGLTDRIAAYGEEVRRETWRAAIEIAKQPINTLGWGSASGGIAQKIIVDQLEAAAKK